MGGETTGLEIGPWWASASAYGTATATGEGVTVTWTGRIPAQFEFDILESGSAVGTWDHTGDGVQEVSSADIDGTVIGTLTYTGGGAVSGDNRMLVLNGSSRTVGSVVVSAQGQSLGFPVDNESTIPTLYVEITATTCDEAYGEWAYAVEAAFEDEGFTVSLDGYWVGFRGSDFVADDVEGLLDAAGMSGPDADPIESQSPLLGASAALLREYNQFVDRFPNWSTGDVIDMMERAELLLNGLRNLSDCDKRLFGEENVETFLNGLTFLIQNLIIGGAGLEGLPSDAWQHLTHIAARSGVLGPGADNPAAAVAAEQALIDAGEAILEANIDPEDGLIFINDDTHRVMGTGAAMGWSYHVAGTTYDARATYGEYIDQVGT